MNTDAITAAILKALDGPLPAWRRPWRSIGAGNVPRNAITARPYHGVNFAILAMTGAAYGSQEWLTYRQAQACGGFVRKGEKGTQIVFWKISDREKVQPDGTTKKGKSALMRVYTVFNVEQCDELKLPKREKLEPVAVPSMDALFAALHADVKHGGDRACYSPELDYISLPRPETFSTPDYYAATALHELGHWTGHKTRLARDLANRFGSEAYAAEELVAELTSAYLCAQLGIDCALEHHASYIENWRRIVKDDPRAIVTAASKANAAAVYIDTHGNLGAEPDADDADAEPEQVAA
jgi:antirestriction protein ArdC